MSKLLWIVLPFALVACTAGGDKATDDTDDVVDTDTTAEGEFSIRVSVSGLGQGQGLELELNGDETLKVKDGDDDYTFKTLLADGDDYKVKIKQEASCPARTCEVSKGSGTIEGANVRNIDVDCAEPAKRLYTASWGDNRLRIVDDLDAEFGETSEIEVEPRIVEGKTSGLGDLDLDGVTADPTRGLVYVATYARILVFEDDGTLDGEIVPARKIGVEDSGKAAFYALEIDVANDRLYASTEGGIWVFENASELDGLQPEPPMLPEVSVTNITLDATKDRLFVASNYASEVYVYDDASGLEDGDTPDRTISWIGSKEAFNGPSTAAYDTCTDRLYVGSNWSNEDGTTLVVFADASTLDGDVDFIDAPVANYTVGQAVGIFLDDQGRLYIAEDSASKLSVYADPASWTGVIDDEPDFVISGAVASAYGFCVVATE